MHMEFKKLIYDHKNWLVLEFLTKKVHSIDSVHAIKLQRPKVDEEEISHNVHEQYKETVVKWLFTDETKKEMYDRIALLVEEKQKKIDKMPTPVIFFWWTSEIKHGSLWTTFRFYINKDVATYFIHSWIRIGEMIFSLQFKPMFANPSEKKIVVEEMVDLFIKENKDWLSLVSEKDIEHLE